MRQNKSKSGGTICHWLNGQFAPYVIPPNQGWRLKGDSAGRTPQKLKLEGLISPNIFDFHTSLTNGLTIYTMSPKSPHFGILNLLHLMPEAIFDRRFKWAPVSQNVHPSVISVHCGQMTQHTDFTFGRDYSRQQSDRQLQEHFMSPAPNFPSCLLV